MAKHIKAGPTNQTGIVLDDEAQKITLFAGPASIELSGKDLKVALQGAISESNGGDRKEELFLSRNAGVTAMIPSTTFTPIPIATPSLPLEFITGLGRDIMTILSLG